jgi:uncharacterized membrane protein YkvA (DUF1232 family)
MTPKQSWFSRWRESARNLKRNIAALYFALLDPRTPWYAKGVIVMVVAYALSPIDLIPDPIPVLGYLDDLILLPVGIWFALKLIPPSVMAEAREKATTSPRVESQMGFIAALLIISIYAFAAFLIWRTFLRPKQ